MTDHITVPREQFLQLAKTLRANTVKLRFFKGQVYDGGADEYLSQLSHFLFGFIEREEAALAAPVPVSPTVPREVLEPCAWCKQPAQSILVGVEKRQTISCGNNKCAAFTVVASVEQWNTRVHTLRDVVGAGFSLSRAEQYSAAWQIAENIGYALTAPPPAVNPADVLPLETINKLTLIDVSNLLDDGTPFGTKARELILAALTPSPTE